MKLFVRKILLATCLALCGMAVKAQGLEGIIVEEYTTVTAADVAFQAQFVAPLGDATYPLVAGMKCYRVYVDMAPNYLLNSVFGTSTNTLDISSTTAFFNDDNWGSQFPGETRRLDEGLAFDSYITVSRATASSSGAAGCTGTGAQLGVLRTADTNGNLTMCNNYSGFGPGNTDGHMPGATIDVNTVGINELAGDLDAFKTNESVFTTTGSWALLPAQAGPELAGNNRVLIGQFTTLGDFSFHINVSLTAPGGALQFYTHTTSESGSVVSPYLTFPAPVTGCSSSQSAYLLPLSVGSTTTSLLTVGDQIGAYKMVGIPDGLGAYDNNNGTFTLLMNHELANNVGDLHAHGAAGAFVSKWVIDKSTLCVQSGQDLIQTVKLWNGSAFVNVPGTAFTRFCAADLPAPSAFYNAGTGRGTLERIFMNGEESGNEGRAFGHIATGPNTGTSYQLPRLGRFSWENAVAHPTTGDKTVVAGTDDSTPGQVYVYIGTKTTTGTEIDKAGLNNGNLWGVVVSGLPAELTGSVPAPGTTFSLVDLGNVSNLTGATLNTNSNTAGVTTFLRPEDASWDPSNPADLYFVTTNAFTAPSRMWRLHFTDILNPQLGGTITAVLDGTEAAGQKMMDNLVIDQYGQAWIQEDPGNQAYIARIHKYDIATDVLTPVAYHDSDRFLIGGSNFLTQDEEASGIIDMKDVLGKGRFLFVDQAHYATTPTLVEGGQLLELATGDTTNACVPAAITSITGATTLCSLETLALNSAASGTLPITYSWGGAGTFLFGNGSPSALVTGAATGSYTLSVSNACGNDNDAVAVTVNPAGTYFADVDGDSFGDPAVDSVACTQPAGYVANNTDLCPADPLKQAPGICGCGIADTDGDGDGVANCNDICPGFDDNADVDGDGTPDGCDPCNNTTDGTACSSGNPCISGETLLNCVCQGGITSPDSDGDGICDAIDPCDNTTDGTACSTGNPCISGETLLNCACQGGITSPDTDGDGLCDAIDPCNNTNDGTPCSTGNPCISGETLLNCTCQGGVTSPDTDGDGLCDAIDPCDNTTDGTPCSTGNPCISGETLLNCTCQGGVTSPDTDGDGLCDAIDPCDNTTDGTPCSTGNPCISGQTLLNCNCQGGVTSPDSDGDGLCNAVDACPLDPLNDADGDGICGNVDNCPAVSNPGQEDTDLDGIGDVCDVACPNNPVELTLVTDGNGAQTSWEIIPLGGGAPLCNGPAVPYGNNQTYVETCCLPDGCYELKVHDSGGNGMSTGGYVLRDQFGTRIIDNAGDGVFTSLSTISLNGGFCLDLGTDGLNAASCDLENLQTTSILTAVNNPAVSAQYGVTNTTSGYQFWLFDPDGSYYRRIFQAHNTGSGPAGPTKCAGLKLNGFGTVSPPPQNVLLNVRVRGRVAGNYLPFGPACRAKLVTPACTTTQLVSTPGTTFSCGATGKVVGGSGNTGKIFANTVAGATNYRFRFVQAAQGYARNIAVATSTLTLSTWTPFPLICGTHTYDVSIAISFNGGTTYCPFGPVCTVGITNNQAVCTPALPVGGGGNQNMGIEEEAGLQIYPNPNRGDQLSVMLEGIPVEVTMVQVDIHDVYGRQVMREIITTGGGDLNHVMELHNDLSNGLYTVTVTVGERTYNQRLIIE